jgi:hypothetical protein
MGESPERAASPVLHVLPREYRDACRHRRERGENVALPNRSPWSSWLTAAVPSRAAASSPQMTTRKIRTSDPLMRISGGPGSVFALAFSRHSQKLPMSIKPLLSLPGKVAVSIAHGVKMVKMARASEVRLDRRP